MHKKWLLVLLTFVIFQSIASPTPGYRTALIVQATDSITAEFSRYGEQRMPPASLQKLFTAAVVNQQLGPNFRFSTTITGDRASLHKGTFRGDLYLNFSGDPTLSRAQLLQLFQQLKQRGLRRIDGNIYLVTGAFNGYLRARGWAWDDLGICFTAPSSAVIIDHNCIQGALYAQQPEQIARVHVPAHQPIEVKSEVLILNKSDPKRRFCTLDLKRKNGNNYILQGCMAKRDQPLPLNFAINDPVLFATQIITHQLKDLNIHLQGTIRISQAHQRSGQTLAQVESEPLFKMLTTMLKHSDNLIADSLLKTLGQVYFKQPGNYRNGIAAMKRILKEEMGINIDDATLEDGSGLSNRNLIQPSQLMQLLQYIAKKQPKLVEALPIAGVDGTLKYRAQFSNNPLKSHVWAKTGSTDHVANLAGFIKTKTGQRKAFVLMIQGLAGPSDDSIDTSRSYQRDVSIYEATLLENLYLGKAIVISD